MDQLANYDSDSGSSDPGDSAPASKRPRAAPPPPPLHRLPSPPIELPPPPLDSPQADEAPRPVRQFPHVDGQYATHVFLPLRPGTALQGEIDAAVARLGCGAQGDAGCRPGVQRLAASEYHVSLSRTLTLRRQQEGMGAFFRSLPVTVLMNMPYAAVVGTRE
mmetsp:Transcript_33270/g.106824  ORF Transcript_33270/g.106824 Transcript_33270/m.106824 type:complete len:162 (+) Transcript_33270:71-556(+)